MALGHQAFIAFHSLGHPGMKVTGRVIGARVMWPFMKRDIAAWVRDCQVCSRAKVTCQPAAAVQPIQVPTQQFSHIHVDFLGPLTTSKEGFRYLFTIKDRTSRWLEAIPMPTMDIHLHLVGIYLPAAGGQPHTTTAYHPQSTSMVERVHRHLQEGLKARGAEADRPQNLPWVLLNIRTTPKYDSNTSAVEMVYGAPLTQQAAAAGATGGSAVEIGTT